jgi:DNA-directed RNA polymerase delta subunit
VNTKHCGKSLNQYDEVSQPMTFSDVVEVIKSLSTDEKREIQLLLQQYLREERRDEIYNNFKAAAVEQQNGELKFSSNINELRQLIEE